MKTEEVRKIMNGGSKVQFTTAAAGTIIYTPPGWIVLEWPLDGPLFYGFKKSVLTQSRSAVEAVIEFYKPCEEKKKEAERMEKLVKLMKK